MQKIISLFARNYDGNRLVRDEVVSGAEWVTNGEGIATVKFDGTSCMVQGEKLFKRYDAKNGKTPPGGWIPAQDPDPVTGHWPGWLTVQATDPADKWHVQALMTRPFPQDGTYELLGPKVQGNPYNLGYHVLIRHGTPRFDIDPPRTFLELKTWFKVQPYEGIVWHHPDGRMVKIKRRDFGLPWPFHGYDHRWSGWPGAYCQKCGREDLMEVAVANNHYDVDTGLWDTPEHQMEFHLMPCLFPDD